MISGNGSNSVLRLSANGLILVDGKLPGNYDALRARVKKNLGSAYSGPDSHRAAMSLSTGINAKFVENGTPHRRAGKCQTESRLPAILPARSTAPRVVTYEREYQIRLGGVEAQLMHFGNAYSNGDTVVYFPNLKVVAIGDLFASDAHIPTSPQAEAWWAGDRCWRRS